jgi:hypothetical protein
MTTTTFFIVYIISRHFVFGLDSIFLNFSIASKLQHIKKWEHFIQRLCLSKILKFFEKYHLYSSQYNFDAILIQTKYLPYWIFWPFWNFKKKVFLNQIYLIQKKFNKKFKFLSFKVKTFWHPSWIWTPF